MTVEAKIFVATAEGNILQAVNLVSKALDKFIHDRLDIIVAQSHFYNTRHHAVSCLKNSDTVYTNGVREKIIEFNRDKPYIHIYFGCGDEFIRCVTASSNNIDYNNTHDGEKIIFSIGDGGSSHEVADVIASVLHDFGPVYIDYNDCDSEPFFKVEPQAETQSQA